MGQVSKISYDLLDRTLRYDYGIRSNYIFPIDVGISDTTYRIVDVRGKAYFAKLYECDNFPRVLYELKVLAYLKRYNFPVASLVSRLGSGGNFIDLPMSVSSIGGKPFCIFDFIDGYSPSVIDSFHIELLAIFLASFHNLSLGMGFSSFRGYLLVDRIYSLFNDVFPMSCFGSSSYEEARDIFSPFLEDVFSLDYSSEDGIIHGDLFPDNVHFMDSSLSGIFDFSSCCVGSYYFDLGVVVASWCMDGVYFSSSLFNVFIKTYMEYYLGDICLDKLFSWLKVSILFFALQRYSMEKFRGVSNLSGRTYKEYISKLVSLDGFVFT